jgi:hypothetical protein
MAIRYAPGEKYILYYFSNQHCVFEKRLYNRSKCRERWIMIKALYTFGVLSLISAGIMFVFCERLWRESLLNNRQDKSISITGVLQEGVTLKQQNKADTLSPLVKQAADFSQYINPPKPPPAPPKPQEPRIVSEPVAVLSAAKPQFTVIATSYYRSRPEKSVALIYEPGRGEHWVIKGESIGHFVIDSIKDGAVIYSDGSKLQEVAVQMKPPVQIAQSRNKATIIGE